MHWLTKATFFIFALVLTIFFLSENLLRGVEDSVRTQPTFGEEFSPLLKTKKRGLHGLSSRETTAKEMDSPKSLVKAEEPRQPDPSLVNKSENLRLWWGAWEVLMENKRRLNMSQSGG